MKAVIVGSVRSPVGKRNGGLAGIHPVDLSALVLRELIARAGIDPILIDDVIWGCVGQVGEQSADIARNAVLAAGWPESVPGVTVDRQCGSSQQALSFGVASVVAGHYDAVVVGGVESMSRIPIGIPASICGTPFSPQLAQRYPEAPHQGVGAELIAEKWSLSRAELDAYSVSSHSRAAHAQDSGFFSDQTVSVSTETGVIELDEGIRRGTSVEKLSELKPAFKEDGVIHAGNASQVSDGAAALLVVSEEFAARHRLTPVASIHTSVVAGGDPVEMLTAPIPATRKALLRSGLNIDEIGVFEVNEAFASVPLAWMREIGAPAEIVNPNGGAIALGHPLGGSGARILTDLIAHMRREKIQYGLQTMCEGGGQANATILELV